MNIGVKWKRSPGDIVSMKTKRTQGLLWLGNEFKKLLDPYVPADTGTLSTNVKVTADDKKTVIRYASPYAHYQYTGVVFVDPKYNVGAFTNGAGKYWSRPGISKKATGRKLKHTKGRHSNARSKWDKEGRRTILPKLVAAFQAYIRE